ncbi:MULTISPECIES: CHAT domain-containing protein [unclassified Microcoleus]|uniref:CHAT domain-containing protein n=1 Tax=unclassified Microcoleus TaxID=2642155 RepID=UPI002FD0CD6E
MNEKRLEAYLNLINTLLSCPSGEEEQILNANSELVDAGFVEAIVKVVEQLEERGDRNAANFLIDIACQLAEELEMSSSIPTSSPCPNPESQLNLLLQIFQVIYASEGYLAVVYLLLQANLDKVDDNLANVLRSWATATLPKLEPEQAHEIAAVIGTFTNRIWEFPLGNRASNLEIAITGYEVVATVFTREASPEQWATSQNNLGLAYLERIRGEQAENLEAAIRHLLDALKVRTRQALPEHWAATQNNLGNAYNKRIIGERSENLEAAIRCYLAALEVRTREAFPQYWAATQNNLGATYRKRIRGETTENLETALNYYLAALQKYTREAFPERWARTQNNLGIAYLERIQKEQAENLEVAIHCFSNALLEYTREAFPQYWAESQNNLGIAYLERIQGERAENLEVAIRCFSNALEVRTRKAFPQYWAATQNNLGTAYYYRVRGEQAENLEAAIRCYLAVLQVHTREAFPQDHAGTQFSLGVAYQKARLFRKTYPAFATAIGTVESLRGEIVSGSGMEEDKKKLAEESNKLYQRMVEVCLELAKDEPQYYDQAIEYAERSKTRNLVELILSRDRNNIFLPEIVSQLEQLQDKIASGQYQIQTATADNPTGLAQHLQQLRQKRNELQDRYLPIGYGFKLDQFQATLNDHTTIIQWYITRAGFETFIITRHSLQRLTLSTPVDDLKALINWANEYLEAYGRRIKSQWINSLASRLSRLAEILHLEDILKLVPDTCSRLILIPHRYLHLFPLHALPLAKGDFLCDRFPNGVGYAPSCQLLQLAQKREQHRHEFTRILAIQNPTRKDLPILTGTEVQLEKICQHFDSDHSIVLREKEATEAALINEQVRSPHCLHFCCHGSFDFGSPLKSALRLAESEGKLGADADLTLGKIFEKLNLDECRLVTFSACETGITDPTSISDEYVGLISAFLYAGSPSVVSTLWSVDQAATNLFMTEFYKNLKQLVPLKPGSVAIALNKTQKWLRTLTGEELRKIVESPEFQRHLDDENNKLFKESLDQAKLKPYPFEKPYYWAAFVATGL